MDVPTAKAPALDDFAAEFLGSRHRPRVDWVASLHATKAENEHPEYCVGDPRDRNAQANLLCGTANSNGGQLWAQSYVKEPASHCCEYNCRNQWFTKWRKQKVRERDDVGQPHRQAWEDEQKERYGQT